MEEKTVDQYTEQFKFQIVKEGISAMNMKRISNVR